MTGVDSQDRFKSANIAVAIVASADFCRQLPVGWLQEREDLLYGVAAWGIGWSVEKSDGARSSSPLDICRVVESDIVQDDGRAVGERDIIEKGKEVGFLAVVREDLMVQNAGARHRHQDGKLEAPDTLARRNGEL